MDFGCGVGFGVPVEKKMKGLRRYIGPACFSAALLTTFIIVGPLAPHRTVSKAEEALREPKVMGLPHGRVLYVVVEETGCFVGEEFVPFIIFENYLVSHKAEFRPDHVFVLGADLARHGQAVQVYDAIRKVLMVPVTIVTVPVVIGTRRGPIEVHRHHWDYW